jgi:hypothetical protein
MCCISHHLLSLSPFVQTRTYPEICYSCSLTFTSNFENRREYERRREDWREEKRIGRERKEEKRRGGRGEERKGEERREEKRREEKRREEKRREENIAQAEMRRIHDIKGKNRGKEKIYARRGEH